MTDHRIIDGLGNDTRRTRCSYCAALTHSVSNYPSYGRYSCLPCYLADLGSADCRQQIQKEIQYRALLQGRSWRRVYRAWRRRRLAVRVLGWTWVSHFMERRAARQIRGRKES